MSNSHELWTRRAAALGLLATWGSVAGCARYETLADEMEGKFDLDADTRAQYRKERWYPSRLLADPPYFGLLPAEMEHLAGTEGGPGGARLVHTLRRNTINYIEGGLLVGRLLDEAGVKPKKTGHYLQGRLEFRDEWLYLASVAPAILLVIPHSSSGSSRERLPNSDGQDFDTLKRGQTVLTYRLITNRKDQHVTGYEYRGPTDIGSRVFLSSAFPDAIGIRVLSDQWAGIKSIEQLAQDAAIPFRIEPAKDMPGYLRLVLKSKP